MELHVVHVVYANLRSFATQAASTGLIKTFIVDMRSMCCIGSQEVRAACTHSTVAVARLRKKTQLYTITVHHNSVGLMSSVFCNYLCSKS